MNIKAYMQTLGSQARDASRIIAAADTALKNQALLAIAEALNHDREKLLTANALDMRNGVANGLDAALLDRLELNPERIDAMVEGLHLLTILQSDPWQTSPPFERLVGDLSGAYSRRVNIQHRLVYQVLETEKAVKILRLWAHYE
jgi:Txe/YoeB family toxin of toxin-antitoxin system